MSPGGVGVDIKHNSYDRYLNKIKGKAPLRRGVIPPNYGAQIPFNRAFPVYGGKTFKTSIIKEAYSKADDDNFTDDASVLEGVLKQKIYMIQGDENNIKITSPVDLKIASVLIEASNEAPKN
jgi:hypothetical protein